MRMILLTGMMSIAAATAQAGSSVDIVTTDRSAHSIDYVVCSGCGPVKSKKTATPEVTLKPGTQKIVLREVNGEMKVFRTEAWLGGSPVTYVSKASTDLVDKKTAEAVPPGDQKIGPIAIDKDNTTSAVTADVTGAPVAVELPKAAQPFNPQDLKLRLK